jgi:16S rRNA (guanine527-N7)-methyltransferase
MGLSVGIETERIESLPCCGHDVISARALAPLPRLCRLAHKFTRPGSVLLFPKGPQLDSELTAARRDWHIRLDRIASRTDTDAVILKILELKPRS